MQINCQLQLNKFLIYYTVNVSLAVTVIVTLTVTVIVTVHETFDVFALRCYCHAADCQLFAYKVRHFILIAAPLEQLLLS